MKRMRVWFWEWLFHACVRWSNRALIRRSRACGCPACTQVALLTEVMMKAALVRPMAVGVPNHEARPN